MTRYVPLFLLLVSGVSLTCRQDSDERRVLGLFDNLARLAEKRDLEAIMACFAEDYSDFESRDKSGIRELLGGYFSGRTGIVVHRLSGKVEFPEPGRAVLQTEIALSSGPAEALRRLVRISPDLYRLKVVFVRSPGGWLVRYAEWTTIDLTELLPNSLSALKKMFPKS